jgi:monofunctional biosynthetic peptidoglycan transglycosylase
MGMKAFFRWLGLVVMACVALQLFFLGRVALMAVVDPQSTAFQRSEAWRLVTDGPASPRPNAKNTPPPAGSLRWAQTWVPYGQIADGLKRAVIASEDGGFVNHEGVDWEALDKAWQKNEKAEAQAAKTIAASKPAAAPNLRSAARAPKIFGGSTITQQLAKNLLLSGERTLLRKGQEFVLALMLELVLDKQRILEIYLNSVEWGEGIFGAEAAAQHYFRKPAARLSAYEGARLAVMLPRPKYFERVPNSGYLSHRATVIVGRTADVELP